MSPSKLGVFDNVTATLEFTDISISSPTYVHNAEIINIPPDIRNMSKLRVTDVNPSVSQTSDLYNLSLTSAAAYNTIDSVSVFISQYELTDFTQQYSTSGADLVSIEFWTGIVEDSITVTDENGSVLYATPMVEYLPSSPLVFDVDVSNTDFITITIIRSIASSGYGFTAYFKIYGTSFTQIPITFEGINQSPNIDIGTCNDVHLAWQSNRNKYWNIFYSSSTDKLSPFRFDTQITDTDSNSLRPSVAVSRTGTRMIVWHDDRNGDYDIFAARATEGYTCDTDYCKKEMVETFDYNIVECDISIDYEANVGIYELSLEFYKDAALTDLYKTINLDDDTKNRWFIDSTAATVSYDDDGVVQGVIFSYGGNIVVSYIPDKDDGIFDIVLYVKLIVTAVAGS